MGMFSRIEQARVSLGGSYLQGDAKYLVYVEACKAPDNRKKKDLYIVELAILESNHPTCKAGIRASWVCNLSDHEAALGNVKGFLAAALGCADDQIDEAGAEASVSAENPLRGRLLQVEVVMVSTKKDKN